MYPGRTMRASVLAILLVLVTACDRTECDQICRRVAKCKREKAAGGEVPGFSAMDADPTCMSRCQAEKPDFATCEVKKRECGAVLECINY